MLKKNYWKNVQLTYVKVFAESLPVFLRRIKDSSADYSHEDLISRDLSLAIEEIVFSDAYAENQLGLPTFQANIQPAMKNVVKIKSEDKRPDFLWTFHDYVNRSRRDFHVECKRLRNDKNVHCTAYINNGINRFLDKEWSYGLDCDMGLMIGYVEENKIADYMEILQKNLNNAQIPQLVEILKNKTTSHFKQNLKRTEIAKFEFELFHYLVLISFNKN